MWEKWGTQTSPTSALWLFITLQESWPSAPKKPNKPEVRQGAKKSGESTLIFFFSPILLSHFYGCVQDYSPLPLLVLLCECSSALIQSWAPASPAQLLGVCLCHRLLLLLACVSRASSTSVVGKSMCQSFFSGRWTWSLKMSGGALHGCFSFLQSHTSGLTSFHVVKAPGLEQQDQGWGATRCSGIIALIFLKFSLLIPSSVWLHCVFPSASLPKDMLVHVAITIF